MNICRKAVEANSTLNRSALLEQARNLKLKDLGFGFGFSTYCVVIATYLAPLSFSFLIFMMEILLTSCIYHDGQMLPPASYLVT